MLAEVRNDPATRPSLLLRIRDPQDHLSWATFVETYGPLVYRYIRRRGLQEADAAEVMQEVLMQVSQSIAKFDYDVRRGQFRGWLGALTHSKICAFQRGALRNPARAGSNEKMLDSVTSQNWQTAWDEQFSQHILGLALERIRSHFKDRTWRAFELSWLKGRSADEVAEELGCDVDFVYVARSRVLKRLRAQVQELAEDSAGINR
jgi:RNA polymerase sigma-70 factor (ECF subfamily)